jgi:hypothetical protein
VYPHLLSYSTSMSSPSLIFTVTYKSSHDVMDASELYVLMDLHL